ncbi:MAG: KH domain-containing protein [Actinomycetota bacterium]|nr:KH domain-containing protein [Actinomycetota bacterium]
MSDAQTANSTLAPVASSVLMHIVRSIVDTPDAVKIEPVEDEGKIILEVRVADGDLGRVIGRRGRTAQSIRAVVRAAASRDNAEVDVDFLDD